MARRLLLSSLSRCIISLRISSRAVPWLTSGGWLCWDCLGCLWRLGRLFRNSLRIGFTARERVVLGWMSGLGVSAWCRVYIILCKRSTGKICPFIFFPYQRRLLISLCDDKGFFTTLLIPLPTFVTPTRNCKLISSQTGTLASYATGPSPTPHSSS